MHGRTVPARPAPVFVSQPDIPVSSLRVEQRRLLVRGRTFHFVSYDGIPANVARQIAATAPTWFMMSAGKRWPVMPHVSGQDSADVDRLLAEWVEQHVFA